MVQTISDRHAPNCHCDNYVSLTATGLNKNEMVKKGTENKDEICKICCCNSYCFEYEQDLKSAVSYLTQMKNFRLFQTQRLLQTTIFEVGENGKKFLQNGRKHKFLLFPQCFHQKTYCLHIKIRACLGGGLRVKERQLWSDKQ